jgi:hypothetical protein
MVSYAVTWIKYYIVSLLQGTRIPLNIPLLVHAYNNSNGVTYSYVYLMKKYAMKVYRVVKV